MLRLASSIAFEHCAHISWKCIDSADFECLLDAGIDMRALCFDDLDRPRNSCPFRKCLDPKTWASALIILQLYTHQAESLRAFTEHVLNEFSMNRMPEPQQLASLLAETTGETTVPLRDPPCTWKRPGLLRRPPSGGG